MFPLKIDDSFRKVPFVTVAIIVMCSVIHWKRDVLFSGGGLVPLDLIHSVLHHDQTMPGRLLTLVTAFFIHGNLMHLLGNMWYLWIFGGALEQTIRHKTYVLFYLLFGVVSLLVQMVTDPLSSIPIVGASGAIAGVMGMCMVICPGSRILFWFPPIFFIRLPAILFCVGWFALQWLNAHPGSAAATGIAWWAHIGGFSAGVVTGIVLRIRGVSSAPPSRQPKRRAGRR